MKNKLTILASLAATLLISPFAAAEEGKLILPSGHDEISKLMEAPAGDVCEKCGVVTDIYSESLLSRKRETMAPIPSSGISSGIATTPIIGSGTVVEDAREAHQPDVFYKTTVRYDDGTYAVFEQDDEPAVHKGERVEVVDGRVEPRSR